MAAPGSLIMVLSYAALLHIYRCEPELVLDRLAAAEAVAVEQRLSVFVSPHILRGAALLLLGQVNEAIPSLRFRLFALLRSECRKIHHADISAILVKRRVRLLLRPRRARRRYCCPRHPKG